MMENKDKPAYPQPIAECNGGLSEVMDYNNESIGLTKREYFAGLALQGLLASLGQHDVTHYDELASDAVIAADALIIELQKPQP